MGNIKRVVIIGCGRISSRHIEAIGEADHLQLIAVAEHDTQKLTRMDLPLNVKKYFDYREMIRNESIDLVSILTESGNHFEHAKYCLENGLNVLIEKPMTLSVNEADQLNSLALEKGISLFVVKQNRYNPAILKLRQHYESGGFGKLVMGTIRLRWCRDQNYYDQASWRGTKLLDGGVICNQASHHIDMLLWFMGKPSKVFAKRKTALVSIEMEDTLIGTIEFQNGALGIVEATTAVRPKNSEGSISIIGANGMAVVGGNALNQIDQWQFNDSQKYGSGSFAEEVESVYGKGHNFLYKDLFSKASKTNLVTGLEARQTIQLIEAFYKSAEIGSEVDICD